ncbi:hypothetical protein SDC9_128976 [bioreactor metagenome]|uniref:Uncharacterized protein n=1 Tax=bioreactor metagenome TaxID=1076179 RepID=A0A645CYB7_9ZZZZ
MLVGLPADFVLTDVCNIDDGLAGEQKEPAHELRFFLGQVETAGGLPALQRRLEALQQRNLRNRLLIPRLKQLSRAVETFFHRLHVRKDQLKRDGLNIPRGIHAAVHMYDVLVLKAADDMHHRVHLANMREKLIPQPLAPARAAYEARDVHKLNRRGRVFFGVIHLREHIQPFIRYGNDADVRLDGAKRIVRSLCARLRNRVKERALADIRQADHSKFHNGFSFSFLCLPLPKKAAKELL